MHNETKYKIIIRNNDNIFSFLFFIYVLKQTYIIDFKNT